MDARDEARLNDWIEDVANAADRAAVEAMFAADPALAVRSEAMRRDRTLLAGLGAPAVPAEVRAAIDDRVARILLLAEPDHVDVTDEVAVEFMVAADTLPGFDTADWRARRDRRRAARWWGLGAGAGLVAAASVTLIVVLGPGRAPVETGTGAGSERAGVAPEVNSGQLAMGDDRELSPAAEPFRPTADAFVVHGAPRPSDAPPMLAAASSASRPIAGPGTNSATTPVPAVVLSGVDAVALEAALIAMVGVESDANPSVVSVTRNLTTEALARLLPRGGAGGQPSEPLWADLERARGGAANGGWRGRVDQRLDRVVSARRTPSDEPAMGVVIAGDADRRPGWGEQIVFAESGAAWTLSVRADRVSEALAQLAAVLGAGGASEFVSLDPVRWDLEAGSDSWRTAREALRQTAAEDPARIVHIPIVLGEG